MANHAREDPDTNGLDILDTESNPPHNKFEIWPYILPFRNPDRKVRHGPLPTVNVMRNEVVILQEYASPAVHEWISSSEYVCLPRHCVLGQMQDLTKEL